MIIEPITDFEKTDALQQYYILQNAKELLRYLNEVYEGFPCVDYLDGSTTLQHAMQFIDNQILHQEP
jgi:hypothetical protein